MQGHKYLAFMRCIYGQQLTCFLLSIFKIYISEPVMFYEKYDFSRLSWQLNILNARVQIPSHCKTNNKHQQKHNTRTELWLF